MILYVDLDRKLKFPREVAVTILRPDILLVSESTKRIGLIELTVPSEERIEVSGELKKFKYAPLQEQGKVNGWNVNIWAVEVGCKGFPAASMASFLKDIGIAGGERNLQLKKIGEEAMNASRMIWNWSHFTQWGNKKKSLIPHSNQQMDVLLSASVAGQFFCRQAGFDCK